MAKTRNAAQVVLRGVQSGNILEVKLTRFPEENDRGCEIKGSQGRLQGVRPEELEK